MADLREVIEDCMLNVMEKVFCLPRDKFTHDTSFLEDLKATSVQFFPILAALEDEFDIEIQYQDFRREGKTVGEAIAFIEKLAR
jgi:acyl carrier protein